MSALTAAQKNALKIALANSGIGEAISDIIDAKAESGAANTFTGTQTFSGAVVLNSTLAVNGAVTFADAIDIAFNATTGTKIGTATTQKIGFFNAAPVAQPSAITQTYSTADATHAARTAVALTDNSAGTANTTIQALPDPTDTPATADALRDDLVAVHWPAIRNNFADLAASDNAIIADLADTAQLLNSVIDKLQALGLIG